MPDQARDAELRAAFKGLCDLLAAGGRLVVHGSAGIHRTGMFGYALMRQAGLDQAAARRTLTELRQVTAEGVGPDRLAWATGSPPARPADPPDRVRCTGGRW